MREINLLESAHGECKARLVRTLDDIGAGDTALIIADHDTKPVFYQYQVEHGQSLSWQYEQAGPAIWKIRVTKTSAGTQQTASKREELDKKNARPTCCEQSFEELDVRPYPPVERHRLVFEKFGRLQPGGGFVLINDHDPKPLYYQLAAECDPQLKWEYLERGPIVWRVNVSKSAAA